MTAAVFPVSKRTLPRRGIAAGALRAQLPARRHSSSVYCRRRLALVTLALILVLAARVLIAQLGGGPLATFGPGGAVRAALAGQVVYVVQPGDTLWKIASQVDTHGDPRPVVDQLVHQLHGAHLQVGQLITLPASFSRR
ncbi:MAG: LysM peptidoglycan-binding domain-containing protein [Acidimicrobiales bacterium]